MRTLRGTIKILVASGFLTLSLTICLSVQGETRSGMLRWTQGRLVRIVHTADGYLATINTSGRNMECTVPRAIEILIGGQKTSFRDIRPGSELWLQAPENRPDYIFRIGDAYSYVIHLRRRLLKGTLIRREDSSITFEIESGSRVGLLLSKDATFWCSTGKVKSLEKLSHDKLHLFLTHGRDVVEAVSDEEGIGAYVLSTLQASNDAITIHHQRK